MRKILRAKLGFFYKDLPQACEQTSRKEATRLRTRKQLIEIKSIEPLAKFLGECK
jgi:hypothetical protein